LALTSILEAAKIEAQFAVDVTGQELEAQEALNVRETE
jgi:hypothetical protein